MAEAKFCSHCGTKLLTTARFCIECGTALAGGQGAGPARLALGRYAPILVVAVVVLISSAAITIGWLNPKTPPSVPSRKGGAPAAPAPVGQLPEGHPPIALPDDVKKTIAEMAKAAEAQPDNVQLWQQLAEVQYRAGQVDPAYLEASQRSYQQVLERDPNHTDALRNSGNVAFDRDQPQQAIDFYTRYLALKPDDLNVLTDRATMQLAAGETEAAIAEYQKILAGSPSFFQAQFNLGLAFQKTGKVTEAVAALQQARQLAADERTRKQVDQVLARVAGSAAAPAAGSVGAPAGSLRTELEHFFRSHQILAAKLDRLEWTSDTELRVLVHDFPLAAMPEDVRTRFADRIRSQLQEQKTARGLTASVTVQLVDSTSGELLDTIRE
ncbi:MAG: tetratricopeptide repeat protein [Deltaproteobacteria bacterium]|nr:tetratricopeptide repeat protein [Deltaproteobacteria bacterium]